jgi:tRNA/tmRNA/rRNA uracil-C5-methylase (TrmA/RlmC/RlmD family)
LKLAVVEEQLARLGRLDKSEISDLGLRVESLPGGPLGWRSRLRYTVNAGGRAGLLKHRSHEVVEIDECLIAAPAARALPVTGESWPADDAVEVVASSGGDVTVTATAGRASRRVSGPATVEEIVGERSWHLDPAAFWQVHPSAPAVFTEAVMSMLDVRPGERAWDLYGGAGLFTAALAAAVGRSGHVTLVESDERSVLAARSSLTDLPQVTVVSSTVERARLLSGRAAGPDVVVLDPPRSGAGARVVRTIVEAGPRAVGYVACDPAAFARDVATFRALGWRLGALRIFDAFPMTHHMECVGLLLR